MSETSFQTDGKTISGSRLVVAMFGMAILATGCLWFYWDLHLMPYMPLQEALAEEFEKSSPRVEGGQRKMHKGTPLILRVVMRVPFDPTATDPETQNTIEGRIERTKELAAKYTEIDQFETLEVHLYFEPKEKELRQKTFSKSLHDETAADSVETGQGRSDSETSSSGSTIQGPKIPSKQ